MAARDECEDMLNAWLLLLPPQMRWSDADPPSTDINFARLRAKYYGARYIIHRPFLNYALHSSGLRDSMSKNHSGSPSGRNQPVMAPPAVERFGRNDQIKEILRSAEECIVAAMHSTEAFDGVRQTQRLIVTNIFGTAHA